METNLNFDSFWDNRKRFTLWEKFFRKQPHQKELSTPEIIQNCRGLPLGNRTVKSILFSTDMALIENNDADAILAVYPFSPSPRIMRTLIEFSEKPVLCGVGGGKTKGRKSLEMAIIAEQAGASGVIVNIPFEDRDLEKIRKRISIPVVASVGNLDWNFIKNRINAGADIFHVAGGKLTAKIVEGISDNFPNFPIMATGGNNMQSLEESIDSGAGAIVLTPPSAKDLFRLAMKKYRQGVRHFF